MITEIKNINDLIQFIEKQFGVDLSAIDLTKFDNRIPTCLKVLYAIEDFFATYDCKYESIRFFNNQYHLISYSKLKIQDAYFDIIFENQNNWRVALQKGTYDIYLSEHCELPYNTKLNDSLEHFLISFALHEIIFNCNHYCQINYKEIDKVKKIMPLHKIWKGKLIDYPINFYLTKQNTIVMDAGWIVLGTNKEQVFEKTKGIIKTILF